VVPFAYAMHAATGAAIKQWVGEGGFLFAGLWCGAKDGSGFGQYVVPGFGLDEVFGARESRLTPVFSVEDSRVSNMFGTFGPVPISGRPLFKIVAPLCQDAEAQAGDHFNGFSYVSSLKPAAGTDVIAQDERGDVVAVRRQFGKGQALMVGTFLVRQNDYSEDGLSRLVHDFAGLAGIQRPAVILNRAGREVEAKLLIGPGKTGLLVLLNAEKEAFDFNVHLNGRVLRSAHDLETGKGPALRIENGSTFVSLAVPANDAAAIYFAE